MVISHAANALAHGAMQSDDAAAGAAMIFMVVYLGFIGLILLWLAICWSRIFVKAGQPGWAAFVPVYNYIVGAQIAQKPAWWGILCVVPCANIVFQAMLAIAIAERFGKSTGYGIGLWLLNPIFSAMLGFGSSQYNAGALPGGMPGGLNPYGGPQPGPYGAPGYGPPGGGFGGPPQGGAPPGGYGPPGGGYGGPPGGGGGYGPPGGGGGGYGPPGGGGGYGGPPGGGGGYGPPGGGGGYGPPGGGGGYGPPGGGGGFPPR